jgi:hypothetical protein
VKSDFAFRSIIRDGLLTTSRARDADDSLSSIQKEKLMSRFRITLLSRAAAVAALLVVPAVSAVADEQYYASPINPVPELSGQKIRRSDVHEVANTINPHPELMGQGVLAVAGGGQNTQSVQNARDVPKK